MVLRPIAGMTVVAKIRALLLVVQLEFLLTVNSTDGTTLLIDREYVLMKAKCVPPLRMSS
jgi:hypothetical protein